jgi:hypothetical protein
VAAATNADLQLVGAGEADRGGDIGRAGTAGNQGRVPIHHRVPDPPGLVIAALAGQQHLALEPAAQPGHLRAADRSARSADHHLLLGVPPRSPGPMRWSRW